MTYKGLWRIFLAIAVTFTLSACDTKQPGIPAIEFDIGGGSTSLVTTDSILNLAGTARSAHPIQSVSWSNDRGGSGTAQGGDNWQVFNISLYLGENYITVTASDEAGNTNSRSFVATRESPDPAISGADLDSEVSSPVLMYSYDPGLQSPAPANGAKINAGPVYFYVVPSDSWRQSGIDHVAYYCCDKPGAKTSSSPKMAVSREPWSMVIDMSEFNPGEQRSINIEANLVSGAVLKAPDFDFTMSNPSAGTNRPPSISGNPPADARVGSSYDFRPNASDADSDTLSFSVTNPPSWARFDPLTGRLWGTPESGNVGINRNIVITATDGKANTSLPAFSIDVASNGTSPGTTVQPSAPDIVSFTASTSAITRGASATLRWSVNDADSVSISPQPGQVSGTSVSVSPTATTTYTLTARNAAGSDTATVTVAVLSGSNDWSVSERPPTLSSPRSVDLSTLGTINVNATSINCSGKIYRVSLGDSQDAVVYMSGSQPLKYPLQVTGGRNVRIKGLHFSLVTQSGCGVGELPNNPVADHPNASIHPRIPGAIAVRVQQSGITFIEGLHIDVRGHEADCIVSRNPDSMTDTTARKQRDVIVQNTYCAGVEGLGASDVGDGVHGDFFQNQGRDIMRRLVFENVSMRTSQEGIVLHGGGSVPGAKELIIRRYDYTWDPRYVGDDRYEQFGLAFAGWSDDNWTLDSVYIDDYRDGGDYINVNGQRYGNSPNGQVLPHPDIRSGLPAEGSFALPGRTGVNYVSPH